eukprot:9508352-Lingulodinium_polyedra.AAC.1
MKRKGKALEEAEAAHAAYEDYQTFKDKGAAQPEFLKAMDLMDLLCPRFRYFNVCRAKTGWNYKKGARATCGFVFPQKM